MNVKQIFEQFTQKRILVLGDVMIDAYLQGKVSRVSPEAPVPIVNLTKRDARLGGAANVALNLMSLGAKAVLCGVVGNDRDGERFMDLLVKRNLSKEGIVICKDRPTTVKTRILGDNQHLLRIDEEVTSNLSATDEEQVLDKVREIIKSGVDALIIEDYNKGLLTPRVIEEAIKIAKNAGVIVSVDPKKENFFAYKEVTLFKPNLKELKEGLNKEENLREDKNAFENAVNELIEIINSEICFVTLSQDGVFIKNSADHWYIPAHVRNIADVSGAGDTVIAVATLCLTVGLEPKEVAEIANLAGGLVCEVSGVIPVDKSRLEQEVQKVVLA